ncbi:FAD binding domain-containing protein, partial [Cardiosporidium cionae]
RCVALPSQTDVIIVGSGPVGATCSLLLTKLRISNILVDKRTQLPKLPQAHYISNRTMEIWRSLGNFDSVLKSELPPLKDWRRFVYCHSLSKKEDFIAARDHFAEHLCYASTYFETLSPCKVGHIPQHRVLSHLYEKLAATATPPSTLSLPTMPAHAPLSSPLEEEKIDRRVEHCSLPPSSVSTQPPKPFSTQNSSQFALGMEVLPFEEGFSHTSFDEGVVAKL